MNALIDISKVTLETKRLFLRSFQKDDVEDFYEYAKVPGVGESASWPHHESIEDSKRVIESFIKEKRTFALVDKKTNRVIGSIGIDSYKESLFPELQSLMGRELGCVLSKAYWGQGLMPEAIKRVIEYLFTEVKLDFIVYSHAKINLQSQRVCEKNGFRLIQEFYAKYWTGQMVLSKLYILYYEEWKKNEEL